MRVAFNLIGLASIGAALLQPQALNAQAQRVRIQVTMERHGYVPLGRTDIGNAITIMKFASRGCDDIRVLPVSIQFQESALLRKSEGAEYERIFVYRDKAWKDIARSDVAVSHLSQKFQQMMRLRPDPATDTMLYIVSPKKCGAIGIDWSEFWSRGPAI